MTRRIAIAILLTVWATLLAGGVTTYLTIRAVLVADLDDALVTRALSLPQLVDESGHSIAPSSVVRPDDRYIVRNELGQTVARPTTGPAPAARVRFVRASFGSLPDGSRVRTVTLRALSRAPGGTGNVPVTISFSGSARDFDQVLEHLAWSMGSAGVFGAMLSGAIARWVAKRCLRPLQSAAEVIGSIDDTSLDRRIDSANLPRELAPVASRLNQMLERLDDGIRKRKQFTADASHELRTPVAALTTALEVALRRDRDIGYYRQTLQTCLIDARLLGRLVEALLAQVKSELNVSADQPEEMIDVGQTVGDCACAISPLARDRGIGIELWIPAGIWFCTQPDRFRSIMMNLIGNAVEHNNDHGKIMVSGDVEVDGHLRLEVRDTGPGIAPQHLDRLFEPFYRADAARSGGRGTDGKLGLGLFLVQTHARVMGGTCTAHSVPGSGATFVVRLPGATPAPTRPAAQQQQVTPVFHGAHPTNGNGDGVGSAGSEKHVSTAVLTERA